MDHILERFYSESIITHLPLLVPIKQLGLMRLVRVNSELDDRHTQPMDT